MIGLVFVLFGEMSGTKAIIIGGARWNHFPRVGGSGKLGIAAHRDASFRALKDITIADTLGP